ncbi:reverse transcriptase domain-containing protein [Tanacetum coccineum]|uniref:Reverse transcriptase domain-containing protein n=1 Tax=Tanacetum coccineum TaxID=301880 RepID=A0ABQ4Z992_9ASTR
MSNTPYRSSSILRTLFGFPPYPFNYPTRKLTIEEILAKFIDEGTVFREPPYPFNYPTRRLTMKEMLAKFIDEGRREHEEMKIFIKEFRTTNELLLKTRSNLLSELKIEEKPHDDGEKNKSSSIHERTTQPLNLKQLDINISFIEALVQIPKYAKYLKSLLTNKSRLEEACTETTNKRCSAVLLNELPSKEKDLRNFTIPCQVLEKHKEAEDLAADHLSRFKSLHMEVLTEREIADKFSDKHLMVLKSKFKDDEPWYVDFVNYIVGKVVPPNWTFEKRKRFFSQVKTYFWEEPYAFKLCADNIMRRCVAGSETLKILAHCHSGPTGGHHSANISAKKVYLSGFYWPSVFKDANEYVRRCDVCQRPGNISSRNEMPQNNIQVCEIFDVCGLDFMGPFPQSRGNKYILVAVDYVSKWVEAQALPTNDARVVVKFLRSLFARFGVPKALISDRGTRFCKSQLEKALQRYGVTHKLSMAYHPQSNGQTEVTNRAIKRILERSVGKLKSKWSCPNIVKTVYPHGAIEITNRDGFSFKVNGKRLKKYYRGDIDNEDDEVIELENDATRR